MAENEIDFIEYGVAFVNEITSGGIINANMWGMTQEEAEDWVEDWVQQNKDRSACVIIRRPVGKWAIVK